MDPAAACAGRVLADEIPVVTLGFPAQPTARATFGGP
jgi:hypothetical protein